MRSVALSLLLVMSCAPVLLAAEIDGPANLRDKPGGNILVSVNDNVTVERLETAGDWHRVAVSAFVDNAAVAGNRTIAGNTVLHDGQGRVIGRTLDVVGIDKEDGTVGGRGWVPVRIVAFTHRRNLRGSTGRPPDAEPLGGREAKAEEGGKRESRATAPPLTREEEQLVARIGITPAICPGNFRSEDEAIRYLKIVLKRDHRTMHFPKEMDAASEEERIDAYGEVIRGTLYEIQKKKRSDGVPLAIEIVKTRKEYPDALAGAAATLRAAGDNSVLPYLHELSGHPDPTVRYMVEQSLFALGDIDAALQVVDGLAKEGVSNALRDVLREMSGKPWEKRGVESIRKALSYENKESRAVACEILVDLTKRGVANEDLGKLKELQGGDPAVEAAQGAPRRQLSETNSR